MANETIKREANYKTVAAGVGSDADQDISMLRVDPITGYLLVAIADTTPGSVTTGSIAKRDGNYRPVCMAWDETNNELAEIAVDSSGYLLCDLLIV